ncbi:uncharacterized protein EI90DRAFT_3085607 [Cantharellus anzutake]|uniref:uncharacterized protein n=1 Tax=Cantharellus anzutake TaxID=1750568 RepID=UPI001905748E|nr:uncharacterized protein EI90DRAFT_3085607 [Cantharellus anzutake]KAF8316996.1 hypothetical protein EI90DRAFT_3085607 [Cantharellus anzutake]
MDGMMLVMGWINFFFQGFVLSPLFPAHLCTALRTAADSTPDMAAQASPFGSVLSGANAPPDNLQFAEEQYKWVCDGVETGVLEKWGKIRAIK